MHSRNKRLTLRAVLLAQALVLGFIERLIPFEFAVPGVKLGLANAAVLTCLYLLAFWDGFAIVGLKCILSAVLFGSASTFIFSVCGSILSFFTMYALIKVAKQKVSPAGVSVAGAVAHNIGQVSAAAVLMGTLRIAYYLPALLVSGVITGFIIGFIVKCALKALNKAFSLD